MALYTKSKTNLKPNTSKKTISTPLVFTATPLTISTCTIITNLNTKINLGLLSRFVNVYDQTALELDCKTGGIFDLEYYGNCARGETLIDRIKDEFNNQATIKFKYWGFRNINIKVFANGKLQMTGLKCENEGTVVANLLINVIKNVNLNITNDISIFDTIPKMYNFQLLYDNETNNVVYYRKHYDRFLKDYDFDTNLVYSNMQGNMQGNMQITTVKLNRKGFVKGVHDVYTTYSNTIEEKHNINLHTNVWNGDNYIINIINKLDKLKEYFVAELENTLSNTHTLTDVKLGIELLIKKYSDFKFPILDKILSDIGKEMYSIDSQTLIDVKHEIFKCNRLYNHFIEKKINRLISIRTIDISICNGVKEYLNANKHLETYKKLFISNSVVLSIPIETIELSSGSITEPYNYFVSNTITVLINSDLSINHNINLPRISKILRKLGYFNSYEPDEYPGVLTKYYYNLNNTVQGICNCSPHCSTKEKHSICTKITISVFRPGSVIITGARNLIHLMSAHTLIIKVLKDNIEYIKGSDVDDEHKQIALMNNEYRKISRKPRLFFVKKQNITIYDK